jgi:hypothetical protein
MQKPEMKNKNKTKTKPNQMDVTLFHVQNEAEEIMP